jgi:phosphoserine phosphatase
MIMKISSSFLIILILFTISCTPQKNSASSPTDPLQSWNNTPIKQSILDYLNDSITKIPVEDRIAVFDMDGTIACETPLWFEMYAAVKGLNDQSKKDPKLLKQKEYQYAVKLAINPFDTSVTNHWGPYIDPMVWKAYEGKDNEVYVDSARAYLTKTKSKDPRPSFKMPLAKMFYQPMLELLQLLKEKQFSVYVVSGSVQGVIWSTCPQTIGFDREHLIGTVQADTPVYVPTENKTKFLIKKEIYQPKNDKDGKSQNIYSRIGKVPVFAFGNTTSDFGMFRLVSTSKYPNACYLLNHDDSIREYFYLPWHGTPDPNWQKTMKLNRWKQVDMSKEFSTVWMTNSIKQSITSKK